MKRIRNIGRKLYPHLKNKFVFTSLLFLFWMTFFDSNNFIYQVQNQIKLAELENHRDQLAAEIAESNENLKLLQNDKELLEKFARERYLMKKQSEDIFVFAVEEE